MRDENVIAINEIDNAASSLEVAAQLLNEDMEIHWNWIAIAIDHAFCCFAIANLNRGDPENIFLTSDTIYLKAGDCQEWVVSKKTKRAGSPAYTLSWEKTDGPPKSNSKTKKAKQKKLLGFWSSIARVSDERIMAQYVDSCHLEIDDAGWTALEYVHGLRNDFVHYSPKTLLFDLREFVINCLRVLDMVKFLAFETNNVTYYDLDHSMKRIQSSIEECLEKLNKELN